MHRMESCCRRVPGTGCDAPNAQLIWSWMLVAKMVTVVPPVSGPCLGTMDTSLGAGYTLNVTAESTALCARTESWTELGLIDGVQQITSLELTHTVLPAPVKPNVQAV